MRTNAEMAVAAAMLRPLVHVESVWVRQLHQVDHLTARQATGHIQRLVQCQEMHPHHARSYASRCWQKGAAQHNA